MVPPGSVPEPRPDLKLETNEGDRLSTGGDYNRLRLTETGDYRRHYTIRRYLEPPSRERMFRLEAGGPATVMASINTLNWKPCNSAGLPPISPVLGRAQHPLRRGSHTCGRFLP